MIDSADRIAKKAETYGKVAVFIVAGKLKTVGGNAKDFDQTVKQGANRLLGIYSYDCPLAWIETDLAWAEKNMAVAG